MNKQENIHFLEKQFVTLDDFDCKNGWILDFGGGGEGIIGILKGEKVIAIDKRISELEEALERDCKALLIEMDGTDLKFLDNTFPTVTAFFSLMYVKEKKEMEKIFKEIYRVLKPAGKFLIWDANLELPDNINKKLIAFHLDVILPNGKKIQTGYGTPKISQNSKDFRILAESVGFKEVNFKEAGIHFFLEFKKP